MVSQHTANVSHLKRVVRVRIPYPLLKKGCLRAWDSRPTSSTLLNIFRYLLRNQYVKTFIKLLLRENLLKEEFVTLSQLKYLEGELDNLFKNIGIDIEFSRHFFERVNDERNGRDITIDELRMIFKEVYVEYKNKLKRYGSGFEAVFKNPPTAINIPFVLQWDNKNEELDLITKTIMRKKNFMSDTPILPVGSNKPQPQQRDKFNKISLINGQKIRYYQDSNRFETLEGQPINADDVFDSLTPEMQDMVLTKMA